ncbi:MAG: class I SAM-dependent methyltransferase [Pseudomonadota bacterium]
MAKELKNLLVNWLHDRALKQAIRSHATGDLLDVGCGRKPYAEMIAPFVASHVGIDYPGSPHEQSAINVYGRAERLPFREESFDTVLCTAVLEHLAEGRAAVDEAFRVLKPGGTAIYSVPFIWHLHEEPHDYYRYSKYGLDYVFKTAGFSVESIEPLSGFWVTFGQLFVYNIYRFNVGPLRFFPIIPLVGLLVQLFALLLDQIDRSPQWTWMYLIIARKRDQNEFEGDSVLSEIE